MARPYRKRAGRNLQSAGTGDQTKGHPLCFDGEQKNAHCILRFLPFVAMLRCIEIESLRECPP